MTSSTSTTLPFVKMHHCGNDYVYINLVSPTDREIYFKHFAASSFRNLFESKSFLDFVVKISHRRFGVGSDGVICLVPPPTSFSLFDVRMKMFNADGSCSKMCGNGLISLAALYSLSSSKTTSSETGSHLIRIATGDESDEKPDAYSISVAKVTLSSNDADNDDKKTRRIESVEIKIIDKPILANEAIPIVRDDRYSFFYTTRKICTETPSSLLPFNIQMFENQPIKIFPFFIRKSREPELFEELSKFVDPPVDNQHESRSRFRSMLSGSIHSCKREDDHDKDDEMVLLYASCIGMGNPHALVVYERNDNLSLEEFPLDRLAKLISSASPRHQGVRLSADLIFPEGANVSVGEVSDIKIINGSSLKFSVSQRTFERGSGETLACGSGSCSLVIAAADRIVSSSAALEKANQKITEIDAKVFPKGGETRVRYSEKEGVILSGIPKVVSRGEYEIY